MQSSAVEQLFAQFDLHDLQAEVAATYGVELSRLNRIDPQKHARDVLNPQKVVEKFAVLTPFTGPVQGKKLLEIGSGYGVFLAVARLAYRVESFGIEPGGPGYSTSLALSRRLLERCGLPSTYIIDAVGEQMPFPADCFDIVYSTHVLEHVQDPARVLAESVRVLRRGGIGQMVVPNYGSFWDGHYGMFWPPYPSRSIAKLIVRLAGRDPAFVDTLQLLTLRQLRAMMRRLEADAEVLDWGENLFHQRMVGGQFSQWAAVGRVARVVQLLRRLGIAHASSWLLRRTAAITPIVLTFRKR